MYSDILYREGGIVSQLGEFYLPLSHGNEDDLPVSEMVYELATTPILQAILLPL